MTATTENYTRLSSTHEFRCCISGSMRKALDAMQAATIEIESSGIKVLSPAHAARVDEKDGFVILASDKGSPKEIQERHLAAMRESDFIYVVSPGGYIGSSASLEIGYALALGIPVYCSEAPADGILAQFVNGCGLPISKIKEILQMDSTPVIPSRASLADLQSYIQRIGLIRGFHEETARDLVLLLIEEVGELARATRAATGLTVDQNKVAKYGSLPLELADCLIYLLNIANAGRIDLDAALREKERINSQRTWGKA